MTLFKWLLGPWRKWRLAELRGHRACAWVAMQSVRHMVANGIHPAAASNSLRLILMHSGHREAEIMLTKWVYWKYATKERGA